jgi:hypothetical protein
MIPAKFGSILPSSLTGEYFFNISQSEKKNCSWRPCLLAEWNQMKKFYRGSYIDASYEVWFNLDKEFQRRRFF